MKKVIAVLFVLVCAGIFRTEPLAWSQSVAVTWPLTANQTGNSSSNLLITGNSEAISSGTNPTLTVWDYWSGQAQRLYAGTQGWVAGPVSANRYLQFDVHPTALNQLTVTQVKFQYGGEHNVGQIVRADVRISINNWSTWTVLATGLIYPTTTMNQFTMPVSVPPIPAGGTFSLRILPYAAAPQNAGTPTWAAHNNVQIIGTNTPVGSAHVRLHITKSTGSNVVPGNYPFNVTCTGPGGPYTGTNPVIVPLPGSGIDAQVPQNDTCTLTETSISGWGQPIWGGSNAPIVPNGWSAQIGPMPVNTTLIVTNNPPVNVPHVRLHITKSTGSNVVPGNYPFNVTCTGPNGPYTGTNPVIVPLPGSGIDVQVPQGDTCNLTETPVAGWGQPIWGGSTAPIVPNGWSAQIGPMPVNTPLIVTNQPPTTANFTIQKQFQGPPVPGTYTFHISCTNGYSGPGTVQITVPPNPASAQIQIPVNATCTISENPIGGWNPPLWGGSSQPLNPSGWSVTMGPFHPTGGPGDRVQVTNRP